VHTGGRVTSVLATAVAAVALGGGAAAADSWEPGHGGSSSDGGGFDAWAYWLTVNDGDSTSTPQRCEFPPELWHPEGPLPAHLEYNASEIRPGEYLVWEWCVLDDSVVDPWLEASPIEEWDPGAILSWPQQMWTVTAADPQDLLARALAHLDPQPPAIGTSPGGDVASMVGVSTWFWLEGGLAPVSETITAGPLAVTVTATPVSVSWDTGDGGTAECTDEANVGVPDTDTCSHTYDRSSAGQVARDAAGRPAYTVAADIAYVGGYEVTLGGVYVGGQADIGGVARASETTLAVNEAQAINRPAGG
jgi:hypothetical protein